MVKKKAVKKSSKKPVRKSSKAPEGDPKFFAFIATFFSIIGFIVAMIAWRDDKYVMYYAKQSLVLFIIALVATLVASLFWFIPVIGWIIYWGIRILILVGWVLTWVNALSGVRKPVPVVSNFTSKFEL